MCMCTHAWVYLHVCKYKYFFYLYLRTKKHHNCSLLPKSTEDRTCALVLQLFSAITLNIKCQKSPHKCSISVGKFHFKLNSFPLGIKYCIQFFPSSDCALMEMLMWMLLEKNEKKKKLNSFLWHMKMYLALQSGSHPVCPFCVSTGKLLRGIWYTHLPLRT